MNRSHVAYFLVITDIVSMSLVLIFVNVLILMQTDFANEYDNRIVEMRDFTVKTSELPADFSKYEDEVSMKFALWDLIQQRIKDAKEAGLCDPDLDSTIVEINFGIKSDIVLNKLKNIDSICDEIELLNIHLMKEKSLKKQQKLKSKIDKRMKSLQFYSKSYKATYGDLSIQDAI